MFLSVTLHAIMDIVLKNSVEMKMKILEAYKSVSFQKIEALLYKKHKLDRLYTENFN